MPDPVTPDTTELCGEMTDPATPDPGRAFSMAVAPGCAAPTSPTVDADATVTYVDDEPVFTNS